MKKTITFKTPTLLTELTQDFIENIQEVKHAKKSTLNTLLNFSKSLEVKNSSTVKNLSFELIAN
ncbi:MAG: hypothetical protein N4A35_03195 [Flavobacteriales bacterium]|jgi:hypothetical protein|nr:hypothetical protein [Flavobacteriales bacterium]